MAVSKKRVREGTRKLDTMTAKGKKAKKGQR
jgi:hypothetical protein